MDASSPARRAVRWRHAKRSAGGRRAQAQGGCCENKVTELEFGGWPIRHAAGVVLPLHVQAISRSIFPDDCGAAWKLPPAERCQSAYTLDGRLAALTGPDSPHAVPSAVFERGEQRVVRAAPSTNLEIYWLGGATGWGARTLKVLEPGEYICEYIGEVLSEAEAERRCSAPPGRDAYLFNLSTPALWRALGATPTGTVPRHLDDDEAAFVIDAFRYGNVSRFLNHACGPSAEANLTPVFVFTGEDARLPRVAFFANRRISRGEELRYDYDMQIDEVADVHGGIRSLACLCKSRECRGRIY